MTDVFGKFKRSAVMSAIRSSGNKDTELRLIRIFRDARIHGWRRKSQITGKPDFVFPSSRVAIFVDGCFWHGCLRHGRNPTTNVEYWNAKLKRNKARDLLVTLSLREQHWKVIRLWEHDLAKPASVIRKILKAIS